jgi:hypothetical protein
LETAFDQLVQNHAALVSSGQPESKQAELVAGWVEAHDWRLLGLAQKAWLFAALSSADRLNPNEFSIRWTGSITAPTTDQYTFSQLRQYYIDGAIKLWIDNRLVLDTTAAVTRAEDHDQTPPAKDDAPFSSQPVALTAGQPVPFRAELVFDRDRLKEIKQFPERKFPIAVLMWQAQSLARQIVPADAFLTPAGFAAESTTGLKGEYFSDANFSQAVGAFLDPGVQGIWNDTAVVATYRDVRSAILADSRSQLLDESNFAKSTAAERQEFAREVVTRFFRSMPALDRMALLNRLVQHPQTTAGLSPDNVGTIMGDSFMLPGQEDVELAGVWSSQHDPPPFEIAPYPGQRPDGFRARNYEPYEAIGIWLASYDASDAEKFRADYLEKADGNVNLSAAYLLAHAAHHGRTTRPLKEELDRHAADPAVTGDKRAGWLLARAYAAEVATAERPKPYLGLPFLEEAELLAESSEWQFRIKQELVARLVSLDRAAQALPLITAAAATFNEPALRTAIAQWQTQAVQMTDYYRQFRISSAAAQAAAARQAQLKELQRRFERANARGDIALADRYRARLEAAGINTGNN